MKKQIIFIGAVIILVTTVAFSYVLQESPFYQTVSVQSNVATTSRATFKVADKTYQIDISPNETVIDALRALGATSTLSFTGREYPGLGFFVDSINEKKNGGGNYWVFYVNGVSAPMGVSSTLLQAGDIIEWKYEKGF